MQFKLSKEEKDAFNKIHLLSGHSYKEVREVYEGFLYSVVLSYLEKEPMFLPFFGEIKIDFLKDTVVDKGRQADISVSVEPSDFLKRVIGQVEDREESDIEKILKDKIHESLDDLLELEGKGK